MVPKEPGRTLSWQLPGTISPSQPALEAVFQGQHVNRTPRPSIHWEETQISPCGAAGGGGGGARVKSCLIGSSNFELKKSMPKTPNKNKRGISNGNTLRYHHLPHLGFFPPIPFINRSGSRDSKMVPFMEMVKLQFSAGVITEFIPNPL